VFTHFLNGNAAARSAPSRKRQRQLTPFDEKITVSADEYVVASTVDNSAQYTVVFESQAKADSFLADQLTQNPSLAGSLHVISSFELASTP
jgi:hypothetical protein